MTLADQVYERVKLLPEPLAREVLDFVDFLRTRGEALEWQDLASAQSDSLVRVWDNEDDEVWNNA